MKKILVLGFGHLSNGDITIAAEIFRQGNGIHFELCFLNHPEKAVYMRSLGFSAIGLEHKDPKDNKKEFERILREYKPDILLCADVFTMDYAESWTGINLEYLKTLGLPIGSTDPYEWESTDYQWDTIVGIPIIMKRALMQGCDFILRPCPLNRPVPSEENVGVCRLFSSLERKPVMGFETWRQKLGIPKGNKVIVYVTSNWEYKSLYKLDRIDRFIKWMPKILFKYLSLTKVPISLVQIGPFKPDISLPDRIQYIYFNNMRDQASLYLDTLFHADLLLGTNAVSTTLSTAVYYQTPAVVLQNFRHMSFERMGPVLKKMPQWYQEMADDVVKCDPFRLFPWGWYDFLEPILKENPYCDTFVTAPVFEPKKAVHTLKNYLLDNDKIEDLKEKQSSYIDRLDELRPVQEFLNTLG